MGEKGTVRNQNNCSCLSSNPSDASRTILFEDIANAPSEKSFRPGAERQHETRKTWSAVDPQQLAQILSGREARWQKRMELAAESRSLISATFCIPLPLRTRAEAGTLLKEETANLCAGLKAEGLEPGTPEYLDGADGPAVFLPCRGKAEAVKRFCVRQEETLPRGRILDLDVTAQGGAPVGRAELDLPPRRCFLCGRPAAECVAAARHSPEEVAAFAEALLSRPE